ncbi:MAG: tetratricopeptide repeat protein [Bacteroidetes bacterium]|nr:MAG: tetratricopeptide repeat protein [Bacteroidota bacterium]
MNPLLRICCFLLFLTMLGQAPAQEEITNRDKADISSRASMLVRELEQLYNFITNSDMFDSEIETIIKGSFTKGSSNQIFYDREVIVENDLDPAFKPGATPVDLEVWRYLKELDLNYTKSEDFTVHFENVKVSRVYEGGTYPFVQVYFERVFEGKHKQYNQPYATVPRVALVRADRLDKQWEVHIAAIVFFDPDQPIQEETYEVELPPELESMLVDSNSTVAARLQMQQEWERQQEAQRKLMNEFKEDMRRLVEKEEEEKRAVSQRFIQQGDAALAEGDFESALAAYREAKAINPYDTEAFIKIRQVLDAKATDSLRLAQAEDRFQDLLKRGDFAYRIRDYEQALGYYREAEALRPQVDSVVERLREIERVDIKLKELAASYRQGDYNGAVRDFSRALKDDPNNPDLLVWRARCYEMAGKASKAADDYSEALEAYDEYHFAYLQRGIIREAEGDLIPAEADYSRALSLRRTDPDLYARRARLRLRLKNTAGAIADYSMAIQQRPTDADLYYARGLIYRDLNKWDEALDDFSSAVSVNPGLADAWYERGLIYHRRGAIPEAGGDFAKAKAAGLEANKWSEVERLAFDEYEAAQKAMNEGDLPTAMRSYTRAITLRPGYYEAWYGRAETQAASGNRYGALEDLTEAIEQNNQYFQAFHRRGEIQASLNHHEAAVEDFRAALAINGQLLPAHLALAQSLTALGELKEAHLAYEKAWVLNDEMPQTYYAAGLLQMRLRAYSLAVLDFERAIKEDKTMAMAYYQRGLAYHELKQFNTAVKDQSKAIQYQSTYPEAYLARARAQVALGRAKKATPDYAIAIRQRAEPLSQVYMEKAQAHVALEEPGPALEAWEQAIQLADSLKNLDLYLKMGNAGLDAEAWAKAQTWFEAAQSLAPEEPSGLYGLACALANQGQSEPAVAFLEQALASGKYTKDQLWKDKRLKVLKKFPPFKSLVKA